MATLAILGGLPTVPPFKIGRCRHLGVSRVRIEVHGETSVISKARAF